MKINNPNGTPTSCVIKIVLKIVYVLLIPIFFGEQVISAQKNDAKSDSAILRHLKEVEWPKAYREQDTKLLGRILADEFQMVRDDGNWSTKQKELDYIKANKSSYDSFRFEIKRLEVFENGTAVVAGTGHIRGKDKDGEYKVEYQSSNILIKRDSVWKAISSHVSGVKRTAVGSVSNEPKERLNPDLRYFVFQYAPGPAWLKNKPVSEQPLNKHFDYMKKLEVEKILLLGGPFKDGSGAMGIIQTSSLEEAKRIIEKDPAVKEGVVLADVRAWHAAVGGRVERKEW